MAHGSRLSLLPKPGAACHGIKGTGAASGAGETTRRNSERRKEPEGRAEEVIRSLDCGRELRAQPLCGRQGMARCGEAPQEVIMPRWTPTEDAYLLDHAGDGAKAIADALGRTVASVQTHASRKHISLFRRWRCPRCGREVYLPLSEWSGWCRECSVNESADRAAIKNRQIRKEVAAERRRVAEAMKRRQSIYSDTDRKKRELRRLREG